jgi:hypothetical protein
MKSAQYWILILCSILVSALLLKQILVTRALDQKQRQLVDCQETASTGPGYENAWKQLAIHIYQASHQDPGLTQLLKDQNVEIHQKLDADSGTAPLSAPLSAPPIPPSSAKTPAPAPSRAPTPAP